MWSSTKLLKNQQDYSKDPFGLRLKDRDVKHIKISEAQKVYEVYEFKEEIGHGSFGVVVMAIEKAMNRSWAIKIVHKNIAGTNKLTEVDREIKILKVVSHPNIIYLEKVYESPKKIYMVLELCQRELFKVYLDQKPFSEKVTKKVILQLAYAVSYLHKNDIVHRDVKMENILLADRNQSQDEYFIKLTDFGLSIVKSGVGIKSLMTDYCGTITYMPPEILQMKTYSELCDVWAIGVILFMMLYGRSPFMDKTDERISFKICNDEPDYEDHEVSAEAIELLQAILNKDPVQRVTALQITENQWLNNKRTTGNKHKDQNIVDMMKQFRNETTPPNTAANRVARGLSLLDGMFDYSTTRLSQKSGASNANKFNQLAVTHLPILANQKTDLP
ncbi:serine/threonine-protein kinase 33 isoform X1 [Dendroctonus ponderosae]|uniref:serine/threonine-protein kinase 33 isoform X1 n=1 Tax=Dendroctonus ponderosae TaxID=77166 RepID=UPI002035C1EC|nr:serine/threonine-protein kinase 33 isoform X1 [Dendroctonus ponderosae]